MIEPSFATWFIPAPPDLDFLDRGRIMCRATSSTIIPAAAILLAVGIFCLGDQAIAGSCDYPLFVQQNATDANVLFIFDSSGSMRAAVYHDAYDGMIDYSGPFDSDTQYQVNSAGNYSPHDFLGNNDYSPKAPLVANEQGQSSRYLGNYMNWIYYHATAQQRAELPQVTRIEVEKAVLANIVGENSTVRFGVMRLNSDIGGTLVAPIGSDPNDLLDNVNAISAGGKTPLAETLVDAMTYLQDDGPGAPIEVDCQQTFIVILTDGSPTGDLTVPAYIGDYDGDGNEPGTCESIGAEESNSADCSDYLDDVAGYLYDIDLRSDLDGQQNVTTYTVGFSIDIPLLQQTADNGHGLYFTASNAEELQTSLGAILTNILSKVAAGSAVAVVSKENAIDNRLYRSKFIAGSWRGFLEAFDIPYSDGAPSIWEAGEILANRNPDSRTIYTSVSGSLLAFDTSNQSDLSPYLDADDSSHETDIINYVQGEDIPGYRNRNGWMLGDIVDSSPVVVGSPAHFYKYLGYPAFVTANKTRERVVYVGANDGMLHCFRASDGYEMWAYVPQSNLARLKGLLDNSYCHEYFVNGSPKAVDAYVDGAWRTMVVCGQGQGGDGYFALDVTDPSSPDVMWDVSHSIVGKSLTIPKIARVGNLDEFVAFVGSGVDANGEAHLVALNMEDGSIEWSDELSDIAGVNMTNGSETIDLDHDGYADRLYVTDMAGNLWRFDLTTDPWDRQLLLQTGQPIQATPALTVDEQANVLVYFGTGKYMDMADLTDTSQQTFYCVIDNGSDVTVNKWDLVDQTSTISPITATDRGWYIDLVKESGERVTKTDAIVAGVVYFTSFSPNSEVCGAGGRSWLYAVDFGDGSSPDNDDGSENDTTSDRTYDLDDGIGSQPVFDLANEQIIVQSSETKLSVKDSPSSIRKIIVRSWREVYQ